MEQNPFVRSRMTHSLEVAHIGRSIVAVIERKIKEKDQTSETPDETAFLQKIESIDRIVETACLMHDIGNPPFGHFGEKAIQEWFAHNGESALETALKDSSSPGKHAKEIYFAKRELLPDFTRFDGNCQGLRIVSKLQRDNDEFALNLLYPQLAAMVKYPQLPSVNIEHPRYKRKSSCFFTEKELLASCWNALRMDKESRHPLVYVMEAADDIAYCSSDLEDGIEKGIMSAEEFMDYFFAEYNQLAKATKDNHIVKKLREKNQKINELHSNGKSHDEIARIAKQAFYDFKRGLISDLVQAAADNYIENHWAILAGEHNGLLSGDTSETQALDALREMSIKHLYTSENAEIIEIAGNKIITGLLDAFEPLLSMQPVKFHKFCVPEEITSNSLERRLFNRLASKFVDAYKHSYTQLNSTTENKLVLQWHAQAHLIVDHIAGMTDKFASDSFRQFSGHYA